LLAAPASRTRRRDVAASTDWGRESQAKGIKDKDVFCCFIYYLSCVSHGKTQTQICQTWVTNEISLSLTLTHLNLSICISISHTPAEKSQFNLGKCWQFLSTYLYHQQKSKKERITCCYTHIPLLLIKFHLYWKNYHFAGKHSKNTSGAYKNTPKQNA
jgi:hypothetical protein